MKSLLDQLRRAGLEGIHAKLLEGRRLTFEDGMRLYRTPDLTALGYLANLVRESKSGATTYFVRNLHVNYTNICNKLCKFCSFYAPPNSADGRGYVLSPGEAAARVARYAGEPIREIHMVAGINPKLPYQYYLDLLRAVRAARPDAQIKAFTMIELAQIARVARRPLAEILPELRAAGLAACPGGGAEVFSDRVHEELFRAKLDNQGWFDVARAVHAAGIPSNATLLYGHIETEEEKVRHLLHIRDLQDETGGFMCFVPLAFDPARTELSHLPPTTGYANLREIAVARLLLDNFPHVKAFWIMITPAVAQMALWYGADDIDGTVSHYEITHALGTTSHRQVLSTAELLDLITEVGREPVERDALYNPVEEPRAEGCMRGAMRVADHGLTDIEEKILSGERLSFDDGVRLFHEANPLQLSSWANLVRRQLHPDDVVTYVVGRNINYTNVCWVQCKFCTFYRLPGAEGGYVLPRGEIFRKIQELLDLGGTEILIQGGLNPALKIGYFEDLFRAIKARFPVHIHGLSPVEIIYLAKISKLSERDCLERLKAAGLDSIPGAGAEMLVDEVRDQIAPHKDSAAEWLNLMRTAHRLGIRSTVTMMYGSVETVEQRVEHLVKVRDLQDETGGFTAFIPWSFQPAGTHLPEVKRASGFDYLRTVAVSRLMLDNIANIQASWLTQGPKIGQIALQYGVNDMGSTVMEENVVTAQGAVFMVPLAEIERLIRDAGFRPARRNTRYEILGRSPDPNLSPMPILPSAGRPRSIRTI